MSFGTEPRAYLGSIRTAKQNMIRKEQKRQWLMMVLVNGSISVFWTKIESTSYNMVSMAYAEGIVLYARIRSITSGIVPECPPSSKIVGSRFMLYRFGSVRVNQQRAGLGTHPPAQ